MKDEEWEKAYEESVIYPEDHVDEDKHIEGLIRWLSKFPVKKRLQIGYMHTLAAIKFSKMKVVER